MLFLEYLQANSALAGLLEEDSLATEESKLIDNAWRGAEVGKCLICYFIESEKFAFLLVYHLLHFVLCV